MYVCIHTQTVRVTPDLSCGVYSLSHLLPMSLAMNSRRDYRGNRAALFDDVEEGGIRAAASYSSHGIDEHENDRAIEGLSDRVLMLKRWTGDIHEEVDSHNRMLDRMGNDMDSSTGVSSQELWTNLRWCLRPNQARIC